MMLRAFEESEIILIFTYSEVRPMIIVEKKKIEESLAVFLFSFRRLERRFLCIQMQIVAKNKGNLKFFDSLDFQTILSLIGCLFSDLIRIETKKQSKFK